MGVDGVRKLSLLAGMAISLVCSSPGASQSVAVGGRVEAVSSALVTVEVVNAPLAGVLGLIARQAGLHAFWDDKVFSHTSRVTLRVRDVPVSEAFAKVLAGTGMKAEITASRVSIIREAATSVAPGDIIGKIIDGKTQQPLRGATVLLDDANSGAMSSDGGLFRIANVVPGPHTIRVRMLGYTKTTKTTTVIEGQTTSVDVVLEPSVAVLGQVVVTGTVIPTELKAIPNAITVITAKDIAQRGITHIDQLFRGDVPGLFAQNQGSNALLDQVTMFSRGATALSNLSAGVPGPAMTNPIKTYVDGVELSDPKYLSQIDPKSIERIEILTGPQASTIYGSNAINGVMQVFTKRGTTNTPQLSLNLLSGFVQNNFSNALTPQHDYGAQLSGLEGRLSYNAGGSWNYMGPWTPAKQTTRTNTFGGARLELLPSIGRVTTDVALRRSVTKNVQHGEYQAGSTGLRAAGWYSPSGEFGADVPGVSSVSGQTIGFVLGYAPADWWSHELKIGQDVSDVEERKTARVFRFVGDSTLRLAQNHSDRRSLGYTMTARVPTTSLAEMTLTGGADAWQSLTYSWTVFPQSLTGPLDGACCVSRQPGHNSGGFLQVQLGVRDQLFLTYGLRAEWNPTYGADEQPNYAPRYGMAYTQEMGAMTVKVRWSYGRSTRPPQPTFRAGITALTYGATAYLPYYGNYYVYLPNPELTPEFQQGGEGGIEIYAGTHASLVITRYNQTVDGLIAIALVDSARSLAPNPLYFDDNLDADGYGYKQEWQYMNLGTIRNQGWELQGNTNVGPMAVRGTYSWTKSRVLDVNPKFDSEQSNNPQQYRRGATFQYLPEHTWAVGVTYTKAMTTIGVNLSGVGRVAVQSNEFSAKYFGARLMPNRQSVTVGENYVSFNQGYALADLNASHRLSSRMEAVFQAQNLMDKYTNDVSSRFATIGRQIKMGARVRL